MNTKRKIGYRGQNDGRYKMHLVAVTSDKHMPAPLSSSADKSKGRNRDHSRGFLGRLAFMSMILIVGLLLGRAVMLGSLTPFALAAFAASLQMKRGTSMWMGTGLILGSLSATAHGTNPLLLAAMLVSYRALIYSLNKIERVDVHVIPFVVLAVDAGFHLGYSIGFFGPSWYAISMSLVDGLLAFLLTLMFLQIPVFFTAAHRQKALRTDEVIAFVILLASLFTGLSGIVIHGLALESIFARFIVVLFAYAGGAGIGGAVGIITGVILALGAVIYNPFVGILGFSGVLAGVLKEGKRLLVGLGFLLGTAALTLYVGQPQVVLHSLMETCIALLAFFLMPERWMNYVSRFIPGTNQHAVSQQEHARRIKELMTARIEEVGRVFAQLSSAFHDTAPTLYDADSSTNQVIDLTVQELCRQCRKYEKCWIANFKDSYEAMKLTIDSIDKNPAMTVQDTPREMYSRCVKLDQLLPTLRRSSTVVSRDLAIISQLRESRGLVAAQLAGVSDIMSDLALEIRREAGASKKQEAQILEALERLGLEVHSVDIISLEEGKVEIEVIQMNPTGHDECKKLVAPLLTEVLGETIAVQKTDLSADGSYQVVTLSSAKLYDVVSGFASAAKDGKLQSGDSFSVIDVGNGRFAIALSDGMGNGERANQESSAAVNLVQQLLRAGFNENVAIKTVNSALVLRSPEEMYATLDLAVIDLYTLQTEFLKVGSVATFIKRGKHAIAIQGESVPVGILSDIEVQTKQISLLQDDVLVLMSDGILEAVSHMNDPEDWVKRQIERIDSKDPQLIADLLLESAVRMAGGAIKDDMTVLCAGLERYMPEWATIKIPNLPSLRRPRSNRKPPKEQQAARRLVHV